VQTRFILINTSHAGNVGAAARAMKTMGFDDLVLVAPRWPNVLRREETIQRASGALDVLEKCRIVDTLDEALDGVTHLCATAMTPRDFGPPTRSPRDHFAQLLSQAPGQARLTPPLLTFDLPRNPYCVQVEQPGSHATFPQPSGMCLQVSFGTQRVSMHCTVRGTQRVWHL
jgi:tRNA/rRNA methyltransferase